METGMWRDGRDMWQPGGVWCVSCRRVLADSWLELSHKTPEPLGAQLENSHSLLGRLAQPGP